jgi:riboflavin kinase/FMN adenylyltransferase
VDNGSDRSIEVHIIGFEGNLYGSTITVSFLARLRSEVKFGSVEALAAQLEADKLQILDRFTTKY